MCCSKTVSPPFLLTSYLDELKKIDLNQQKVLDVKISYGSSISPNVVRIHPRTDNFIAFGLSNGIILFFD
jgi:hypothetical protein